MGKINPAYLTAVAQAGAKYGVDPTLLASQIQHESGWDPTAHNPSGANGISQFMPGTAAGYHIDSNNPFQSIDAQARMMKGLLVHFKGNVRLALAGYNAGQSAADAKGVAAAAPGYIDGVLRDQSRYPGLAAGKYDTTNGSTASTLDPAAVKRAAQYGNILKGLSKGAQKAALESLGSSLGDSSSGKLDASTMLMNYLVKASDPTRDSSNDSWDITQIVKAAQDAGATANAPIPTTPTGTTTPGDTAVVPSGVALNKAGYVNPLAKATNINPERTDQGVDYAVAPNSPLLAPTDGVVIGIKPNWYKGQPYMWYKITNGPMAGKHIFMAEGVNLHVHPGQKFKAGDVIAHSTNQPTGMEFGFAQANGEVLTPYNGSPDGTATAGGKSFAQFLHNLGAPVRGY